MKTTGTRGRVRVPRPPAPTPAATAGAQRWLSLIVVLVGQFMAALDTTIGNVAAASIERDLRVSAGTAALAIAAYTLIYASVLITGARLGADLGPRRVFLAGIGVFTLASAIVGAAPDAGLLIAGRAVQGFGAALAIPQVISFIQADFDGRARARALTAYGITISLGATAGLAAGGAVISANIVGLGWRVVFLMNLPIGAAVLAVAARTLPRVAPSPRHLDLAGVVLLTLGAALVAGPLANAANSGIPALGWVCLAAGTALLSVFWRVQRRRPDPLLDPAILATPRVRPGLVTLLLTSISYTGTLYSVSAQLQQHQGYSPVRAGTALVPFVIGFGVGSAAGAIVPAHRHLALVVTGIVCLAINLIGLGWLATATDRWPSAATSLLLAGAGLGYGGCFNPTLGLTVSRVSATLVADASGIATTTFQFAFVLGVAVIGSIYTTASIGAALIAMGVIAGLAVPAVLAASTGARSQTGRQPCDATLVRTPEPPGHARGCRPTNGGGSGGRR